MKKIDWFLLKKCQTFSDWCQLYFGITNYTLGRICCVITTSIFFVSNILLKDYFSSVIAVLFIAVTFWVIAIAEKLSQRQENTINMLAETFNDRRPIYIIICIICAAVTISFIGEIMRSVETMAWAIRLNLLFYSFTAMSYFLSCTPKPPSRSKIKELLEKSAKIQILKPAKA